MKAGAFCVIRIVGYTFGPEICRWSEATDVLAWIAVCTILLSSLIAMQKDNLKARLAYSTVGQLSYIVLGVCKMCIRDSCKIAAEKGKLKRIKNCAETEHSHRELSQSQ